MITGIDGFPRGDDMMETFEKFPNIARLSRDVVITEKLDGTNAQVLIDDRGNHGIRWQS